MTTTVRWFPRSWIQIKTEDEIIYIDPAYLKTCFKDHPGRIEYSTWPDPIDGLPEELKPAGLILITHKHKDHCKRVTVDRLRGEKAVVVAPKLCEKDLGEGVQIIEAGVSLTFGKIAVQAVPAYNTEQGSSIIKQHPKGAGVGYLVTIAGKTIYHAGDTDLIPEMAEIGPVDMAFLPIDGKFTMGIDEAVEAARLISPAIVVPIHRFEADPQEFVKQMEMVRGIEAVALGIGEAYSL